MDQAKRRSRTQRTREGKSIALTARDLEIFKALQRYRYLRSTYLHAFAGGKSETRFKERLGDLFHEGFIGRPQQQWDFADARYRPAVNEIDTGGVRALASVDSEECEPRTFLGRQSQRQFQHALLICEVLASIELASRASSAVRFIPWPEIARKGGWQECALPLPGGRKLTPDGLFGLEYQSGTSKAYRFFALEADRSTMPLAREPGSRQSSMAGKFAAYADAIAAGMPRQALGIPNLLVLTVTNRAERAAQMPPLVPSYPEAFLFKAMDAKALLSPAMHLLGEAWDRACGPFAIDRP